MEAHEGTFRDSANVFSSDYTHVETHLILHLRWVSFVLCSLYLSVTLIFKIKSVETNNVGKSIRTESRLAVARGWVRGNWQMGLL